MLKKNLSHMLNSFYPGFKQTLPTFFLLPTMQKLISKLLRTCFF